MATLGKHSGWHNSIAFSPDGKILATNVGNNTVALWDVPTRRQLAVLGGHKDGVHSVAFSPDGTILATSSLDRTVILWNVATRRPVAVLKGHTGGVLDVPFSPDGKTLATSSNDRTIKLWDMATKQEVITLRGHTAPVNSIAFSPDGNTLASAGGDHTIRLWRAATFEEADRPVPAPAPSLSSSGSDRTVTLQWQPVANALGYRLYRGPAGATRSQLAKLNTEPASATSFADKSAGLVNGRPQAYGVAALFKGAAGTIVEGPLVTLQACPVAAPPGFLGGSINEGERPGSARFQPATGEITFRGSGPDIWDQADGFYFLNQPVTGDFQITVRALTRPTETDEWALAGLMIRESRDAGARNVCLVTTAKHGLQLKWRPTTDDTSSASDLISHGALKLPSLLRLTRRGSTITAQISRDNGRSVQGAGQPLTFDPPLASTVYAGLAITAHDESQISEAKFSGLEIRKWQQK